MKTLISRTLLLSAVILLGAYVRAAEPMRLPTHPQYAKWEKTLHRVLSKNISYPLLGSEDMTGEVNVSFQVDRSGHLQVLECRSENEKLQHFVLRKLSRIALDEGPGPRIMHMRFNFHKERP